MALFRTRTHAHQSIKLGPFSFRLTKPLGRGGVRGSIGTRPAWRRRLGLRTPLGRTSRWGNHKRRWR
jgi:hypothetical protein